MTKQELHAQYGPKLVGTLPGPKARAAVEADERLISPSYTRSYPLVAKRGRGIRVEDVDGNEFLDFAAGIAVTSTGHCHPEVVAAIQKQAAELIHISGTDFYNEPLTDLAERLSAVAPMPGPHRFFYGNSGAEAIECALKLARYHTGRQQMIAFLGAFHGRTMGALSLTGSKPQQKRRFAPLVPGVTHMRYPYAYRGCTGGPQEEEAFSLGCARYIEEKLFKTILPPEEVAAIFVEPIQGEGGYVVAPDQLPARAARDLRPARHSAGGGRGAERRGPHGQVVGHRALRRGAGHGVHGQGHCQRHAAGRVHDAARRSWTGCRARMRRRSAAIRSRSRRRWPPWTCWSAKPLAMRPASAARSWSVRRLEADASLVGDVRGRGLMIGIELVKDKATREPAAALRNRVETLAFERGLMVLGCGETSLRLCPPLIVSGEEATVALDILEEALTAVEKEHELAA